MTDLVLLWSVVWGLVVASAGVALGPFALLLLSLFLGGGTAAPDNDSFPKTAVGWIGWGVVLGAPLTGILGAYVGEWLGLPTRDLGWGTLAYLAGVAMAAALWVGAALLRAKAPQRELHESEVPEVEGEK